MIFRSFVHAFVTDTVCVIIICRSRQPCNTNIVSVYYTRRRCRESSGRVRGRSRGGLTVRRFDGERKRLERDVSPGPRPPPRPAPENRITVANRRRRPGCCTRRANIIILSSRSGAPSTEHHSSAKSWSVLLQLFYHLRIRP